MHGLLKILQELIQPCHVFSHKEISHRLQVDPAGKMLGVIVYDQTLQAVGFNLAQRIIENCHRVGIECVCLAVKFNQRDAVELEPAGDSAAVTGLQGLTFFAKPDNAVRAFYGLPATTELSCLQVVFSDPIEGRTGGFGEKRRNRQVVCFEPGNESIDTNFID